MAMAYDRAPELPTAPKGRSRRGIGDVARRRVLAFRKARRHSIAVFALRLVLPVLVVVALGAYGVLLFGRVTIGSGQLSVGRIEVTADDLKMKNLTYSGQTKDGGRYDVRAKEAAVDFAQTGPVRLDFIDGDLTQSSGVLTKLKSRRGLLDNKKGEMDLFDGVEIDASNGLKARLRSAKIYNKEHRVVSRERLVADMPAAHIEADTMDFETRTRAGVFTGDVVVRLTPGDSQGKAALGFGRDQKAPVDVRAPKLEIDDGQRVATFTGGVVAAQGETMLQASAMRVHYEGKASLPGQTPSPANANAENADAAKLSKVLAAGNVVIVAGDDRRVLADQAEFDTKADTALFTGGQVEVTQGKNKLVGRRLAINRKTGQSRLDAPGDGRGPAGRIQTTFIPNAAEKPRAASKPAGSEDGGSGIANFRTDPTAPMDIEADTMDVNDPVKQAIYRGRVKAQQGDFTIQSAELIATYVGETGLLAPDAAAAPAKPVKGAQPVGALGGGPGGAQVTKVLAKGKVSVTSKDGQEAFGDWAEFDTRANTVLLGGGVQVKRGRDVVSGARLRIDTVTGEARFENEPGGWSVGSALSPLVVPKSAPGPGGLPAVQAPTPAPKAPAADASCPPGRQCIIMFPEDAKKEQKERGERVKPKVDGWAPTVPPTSSPSPVYRAP